MSEERQAGADVREGQRIAKVMARAGLCSRREAETWIAAGRVTVNGTRLESPAYNVGAADDVRVDGKPLAAPERTRLFLFHKPRGLITTARDPEGRPTIFDRLPPDLPRLVAVGRLDINTEGLILLTNDGGLARILELPETGWLRRYRVRAHGQIDQSQLSALSEGLTLDGVRYAGIEAQLDREQGSNVWITMGLREGKNREIKKVLEHLGLAVNRLIRVSFGPFELGDLAEGEVAEVRTRVLRDQLGAKLAKAARAEFDAPLIQRGPTDVEPRPRAGGGRASPPEGKRGEGKAGRRQRLVRDEPPRRGSPSPSTPPRGRRHISALRAEVDAAAAGPRKRVERTATHDRKGRTVAVERRTLAGESPPIRGGREKRGAVGVAARRGGGSPKPRNASPSKRTRGGQRDKWPAAAGRRERREFEPRSSGPKRGDGVGRALDFERTDERRSGHRPWSAAQRSDSDKRTFRGGGPREGPRGVRRDKGHGSERLASATPRRGRGPGDGKRPGRGPGGSHRPPRKKS